MFKNDMSTVNELRICNVGQGQILGVNDAIAQRDYTTSIKCESARGTVYVIGLAEFKTKMQKDKFTWNELEI